MMSRTFFILTLGLLFVNVYPQKPETVLFTIGNESITSREFEYIYKKNNKNDSNFFKASSIQDYLNLFINFKLKVKEAKNLGIDTSAQFKKEFKSYRDQLTKPYLTDKATIDKLINEAYERMKIELKASHILVRSEEDALPKDTIKAYNKIWDVYNKVSQGGDFEKLALEYSEDPSVKYNKGNLGYFSVFHLIYPFENVAYNTEIGKVSKPFKTQFGYHILKITDKRPYQGQVKVSLILIKTHKPDTSAYNKNAKIRIDSVYYKLQHGESFKSLVEKYSEDERTKTKNGELPEFTSFSFQIPEDIKEQAFKLSQLGDYSQPFKTEIGWIIIKKIDWKGLSDFKDMENTIRNKVIKDSRSLSSQTNAIAKLKKDYRFQEMPKNLKSFEKTVDTSILKGKWKITKAEKLKNPVFQIGKEIFTQLDFAKYLEEKQKTKKSSSIEFLIHKIYDEYVNASILNYVDTHLEENDPDFRSLITEYKEGMMLFDITDKKVWTKAMIDTAGLKEFYNQNTSKYMWKDRVDAEIFTCKDKEVVNLLNKYLKENKLTVDSMIKLINKKNPQNITYIKGLYEKEDNENISNYFNQIGIFTLTANPKDNTIKVIRIKAKLPPQPKKLEETKGIVISDYQNYLEKTWLKNLKEKYPVKINTEVLKTIIKN